MPFADRVGQRGATPSVLGADVSAVLLKRLYDAKVTQGCCDMQARARVVGVGCVGVAAEVKQQQETLDIPRTHQRRELASRPVIVPAELCAHRLERPRHLRMSLADRITQRRSAPPVQGSDIRVALNQLLNDV